jgi:fumarate reductase subunit C
MSKRYHATQPWNWFLQRPAYVRFMVRELTAVVLGIYLVCLLCMLASVAGGEAAFIELAAALTSPVARLLHAVALAAALFHSISWFYLTPKAMPVFRGENRVPDPLVAIGMGYLPWIVVTILIVWGVRA